MKLGFFFESTPREGGAFHTNINIVNIFSKYNKGEFEIIYIVNSIEIKEILEKENCKTLLYKSNVVDRIIMFLYRIQFFKQIFKKLKIFSKFEKFILQNNIDLVYFNSPTKFSLNLEEIPFVMNIYEMQHRTDNYFPEYRMNYHNLDIRDEIITNGIKKAFKIIVATEKDKKLLRELYNAFDKNVLIQPYVPQLPNLYENEFKEENFKSIYESLNIDAEKVLIYPAQFWAHKNHKYLIDAFKNLTPSQKKNLKLIFTGHEKFNKKYIQEEINKSGLESHISIFEYINDKQLISLYLNATALVMPTFVGHSTLPLYEAFYFNLPVLFSKDLLDESLKKCVYEIDIFNPEDFANQLEKLLNDNQLKETKLKYGKQFYENNCKKYQLYNNLKNVFEKYNYLRKRWK